MSWTVRVEAPTQPTPAPTRQMHTRAPKHFDEPAGLAGLINPYG